MHIKFSSPHTKRQNQLQWWGSGSQVNCTITFAAPPRRPGAWLFRPTSICQEGQWADVPGLGRSGNQLLCPKQNAPGSWPPGSQARQSLASLAPCLLEVNMLSQALVTNTSGITNIARGTTNPGYKVYNLRYLFNVYHAVVQLTLIPNLATNWCHLHWLQIKPPDGAAYIGSKFSKHVVPLFPNLTTRWRHLRWFQISPPRLRHLHCLVPKLTTRLCHSHCQWQFVTLSLIVLLVS